MQLTILIIFDIAIPCVRLSVRDTPELSKLLINVEMVGIISPPNNILMLAFGQLIAVTKFATGPQILERYEMCATRRVRGLSRNGARYSFNSYNS